ncbi:hypothetical protein G6L94_11865 [Agrobacterium rhizogenes]|nr:hypothetical protein [Rhizobium rhizogenes]NTI94385.1 hypothetical protein [Rhizobium rhizogenes]NTJ56852.1 hypothetical protein [Rhizobium rhizogenes]OCJ14920.1 hypothetical protein A6U89_22735 [Agrobacterium sp. B133/95]
MRAVNYSFVTLAILFVSVSGKSSSAQTVLVPPTDHNVQSYSDMAVTKRGNTASNAADLVQAAASWVNELGVRKIVDKAVTSENGRIKGILQTTGQPGVLYRVEIERTDGETPFYGVVGGGIQLIGAGSTPIAVNSAINQQDQLRPAPTSGATVDLEKSYFLWFSKDATGILATALPAYGIINETARRYADQKLLDSLNAQDRANALQAAVIVSEKTIKDRKLRDKIATLRKEQQATDDAVTKVSEQLSVELERVKKAQRVGSTLSMLAGVLNLASQVATLTTELGADTPASVKDATSNADLQKIAKGLEDSSQANVNALQVQYTSLVDKGTGIRTEYLGILRTSNYPINQVPELTGKIPVKP